MDVYIATTYSNLKRQKEIATLLYDNLGITLSYDWTAYGAMTPDQLQEMPILAAKEEEGVRTADALILILPSALGSQTELGIAIALDIPVVILVDNPEHLISKDGRFCVFHHRKGNVIVYSEAELLAFFKGWLGGYERARKRWSD